MSPSGKGVLLAVASYVVTMGVVIFIVTSAIIILLMWSVNCSGMGRALLALWILLAVVCIASEVVYIAVARRYVSDFAVRRGIAIAYGVVVLASYFVIAFGLMVLFNC